MDLDTQYPNLSRLVQPKTKCTLNQLGTQDQPQNNDLFDLESSCWDVLHDQMNFRGGPYQTLKTLDEFIRRLPPHTPIRPIRNKICAKGSEFLDTVVEATWALHFWTGGHDAALEQRLDPTQREGKNADIVVTLDGIIHWLDATSIQLSESEFPIPTRLAPMTSMPDPKAVANKLADKSRAKYNEKFGLAVRGKLLKNGVIGILLAVIKSEKIVIPAFAFDFAHSLQAPPMELLDHERPGLNLVWVHTLGAPPGSDILEPAVIAKWEIT